MNLKERRWQSTDEEEEKKRERRQSGRRSVDSSGRKVRWCSDSLRLPVAGGHCQQSTARPANQRLSFLLTGLRVDPSLFIGLQTPHKTERHPMDASSNLALVSEFIGSIMVILNGLLYLLTTCCFPMECGISRMLDILLIEEFLSLSTDQKIMEPLWTSTRCAEGVP